jgi:sec-independent protein translocase protein TatA
MLGGLGPTEVIIVLGIALVVFGAGKLPDIASGLGKGLRDFKKAMRDLDETDSDSSPKDKIGETRSKDKNGQG